MNLSIQNELQLFAEELYEHLTPEEWSEISSIQ